MQYLLRLIKRKSAGQRKIYSALDTYLFYIQSMEQKQYTISKFKGAKKYNKNIILQIK